MKPASCQSCVGAEWPGYMAQVQGACERGVLLAGDVLGAADVKTGAAFGGQGGGILRALVGRKGWKREEFPVELCLRCRPPLSAFGLVDAAFASCRASHLDRTVESLKPKVIVPMGDAATRLILGVGAEDWANAKDGIDKRRGYVEWSTRYDCWVLPTYSPDFIRAGNQHLTGVWLRDVEQAMEIAKDGFSYQESEPLLDPSVGEFSSWVLAYEDALLKDPNITLAYDIETPYKAAKEEEDSLEFDDPTYDILRISFAYQDGRGVSIPWSAEYVPLIKRLMAAKADKFSWNGRYDRPRMEAQDVVFGGIEWDLMWAWHVLNSALPKGLGFVAPFYAPRQRRWKHLGADQPAYYNALDSIVTWRLGQGLIKDLRAMGLWNVYEQHITRLDRECLWPMSAVGVGIDMEARKESSLILGKELVKAQRAMEEVIPLEARRLKVYKKLPSGLSQGELVELPGERKVKVCGRCGLQGVTKPHVSKKTIEAHTASLLEGVQGPPERIRVANPCLGATIHTEVVPAPYWGLPQPFVPSKTQLLAYQRVNKQRPVFNRDTKETFDDLALKLLIKRYPKDPLYPLVGHYRGIEKIQSSYVGEWDEAQGKIVGGFPISKDGRLRCTYTHVPSTLRLSSQAPNLQTLPRDSEDNPYAAVVKRFMVAAPGCVLAELDFSAIEAVLVGYFANSKDYIRLAKLGVHDYLNSHILARDNKIKAPADLSWSDADLKVFFKDLKKRFKAERDVAKRLVHSGNYGMTPGRMRDIQPELFPTVKVAQTLQNIYFDVCPDVRRWQEHTVAMADKQGYLRNPYGYIHRFYQVRNWKKGLDGEWYATWAEDAKRALAFMPQSTAAGIIREAMLRVADAGLVKYLRLQVHDSLVLEMPEEESLDIIKQVMDIMTEPIKVLPLDPAWGMGDYLQINAEAKMGRNLGEMEAL